MENKIGVCAGHYNGANIIPEAYRTLPSHNYSEGTTMQELSTLICKKHPNIYNARTGSGTAHPWHPNFFERANRMRDNKVTHAFELHTNWSVGAGGKPNRGTFLVIVSLCYEAGKNQAEACAAEKALATKLWKPLADRLGLRFVIHTRKGGGNWDYYSFINFCKQRKIAHPMIIEHGYHMDFAEHKALWLQVISDYYDEVARMLGLSSDGGSGNPPPNQDTNPTLHIGDRGAAVRRAQILLNRKGANPLLVEDGIFGALTEKEVNDFKRSIGLPANGVIDAPTWDALYC